MRIKKVSDVTERTGTGYPEPFCRAVEGRRSRRLAEAGGLTQFGVNIITLAPGAWSSQRHWHTSEDEFVLMLTGELVLVTDAGRHTMKEGDFAGFPAGESDAHHLINESEEEARFLVVGTADLEDDEVHYPDIDMHLPKTGRGQPMRFTRKSGEPY